MPDRTETIVFGGGCFWCTEAVFLGLKGVIRVTPGYAGGHTENPTHEQVSTGRTGHAEVIGIEYDPMLIPFRKLLEVFFMAHDPTTVNRQGADVGEQYRSIILYTDERQRLNAESFIAELTAAKKFPNPIVTAIKPLERFWPAEEYHRDYYTRNPDAPYSQAVITPKMQKARQQFPELLPPND
ncbi:MAG: peptide-methionine (S)-S-oxide reductase MsrA [Candidatus Sungbacteria bacterium]|uniref:Peptide methionine sulfoxide reductase MsrA n=1 Tax=Candidatus Sungiibacteriota bacterium TaxID=2750080 RepID=A0A932YVP2_9BACT|nr:peptide-methionine (S)-S-oxide reductase MsrA [Candidatus Sungbacteria bacterium]